MSNALEYLSVGVVTGTLVLAAAGLGAGELINKYANYSETIRYTVDFVGIAIGGAVGFPIGGVADVCLENILRPLRE